MNREDIKKWATQAQLPQSYETGEPMWLYNLERFAALVAAAEREACAKVCDAEAIGDSSSYGYCATTLSAAIRARGQA